MFDNFVPIPTYVLSFTRELFPFCPLHGSPEYVLFFALRHLPRGEFEETLTVFIHCFVWRRLVSVFGVRSRFILDLLNVINISLYVCICYASRVVTLREMCAVRWEHLWSVRLVNADLVNADIILCRAMAPSS